MAVVQPLAEPSVVGARWLQRKGRKSTFRSVRNSKSSSTLHSICCRSYVTFAAKGYLWLVRVKPSAEPSRAVIAVDLPM